MSHRSARVGQASPVAEVEEVKISPIVKLALGAILCAAGLIVVFGAERQLLNEADCEDCDEAEADVTTVADELPEESDD